MHKPGALLRVLGLAFGLAAAIGGVVGQGILRTPGIVAQGLPSVDLALLAWLAVGVLSLIDAMSVAELGASVPRAGGPYALGERAFGPMGGFVVAWIDTANQVVSVGYLCVVVAEYLHRLGIFTDVSTGLLALGIVGLCLVLNLTGTRIAGGWQNAISALKGAGLLAFAIGCFLFGATHALPEAPADAPHAATALTWAGVAVAGRAIFGTYGGWNTPVYFSEEIADPSRNMPRSLFGGLILVTVIYVAVNAAIFHVLPFEAAARSNLPAAEAAELVAGPAGKLAVTLFALFSVGTIAYLVAMSIARTLYSMARDGLMPAVLATVWGNGTPAAAVLVVCVLSGLFALSGVYDRLLAIYAPFSIGVNMALNVAAVTLRLREPKLERPYKMPLFPLPALAAFLLNGALLVGVVLEDPANSVWSVAATLLSVPIYFVLKQTFRAKPAGGSGH